MHVAARVGWTVALLAGSVACGVLLAAGSCESSVCLSALVGAGAVFPALFRCRLAASVG